MHWQCYLLRPIHTPRKGYAKPFLESIAKVSQLSAYYKCDLWSKHCTEKIYDSLGRGNYAFISNECLLSLGVIIMYKKATQ